MEPGTEYLYCVISFTTDGTRGDRSPVVHVRYTRPPPAASKPAK